MRLKAYFSVLFVVLSALSVVAEPLSFKDAAMQCDKEIEAKHAALQEEYVKTVTALAAKYQSQGDLEKTVAAKKELSRFSLEKTLGKKDVVEQPAELRDVQSKYMVAPDEASRQIAQDYVSRLEQLKRELTNAGKLDDAVAAQKEMEKIQVKYKTSSLTATSVATGKTESSVVQDPVAACEKEIEERMNKLKEDYLKMVTRLSSLYQSQGDLDATLAASNEWKRFYAMKVMTDKDVVTKPVELRELQVKHLALLTETSKKVAQEQVDKLDSLKSDLTMQGKLDEAVRVQRDVERLRKKFLAVSATAIGATTEVFRPEDSVVVDAGLLRDALGVCEKAIVEKLTQLPDQYVKELEALQAKYQSQGELEKTLAVKTELSRFASVRRISERDVVGAPQELRAAQMDYVAAPTKIGQETAQMYLGKLEIAKRQLTKDGKLDDAMAAQKQIEAIQRRFQVVALPLPLGVVGRETTRGMPGAVLVFDGRDARGLVSHDDAFNPGRGDFSVVAFIKSSEATPPSYPVIMHKSTVGPPTNNWHIDVRDGETRFVMPETSNHSYSHSRSFDNRWHCILLTREDGIVSCYFDGEKLGSFRSEGRCFSSDSIGFGALNNGNNAQTWNGSIKKCSYWSRALTEKEVASIAAGVELRGNEKGLVSYWPMDDGKGDTFRDVVGGYNGKLRGGYRWSNR